MSKVPLLAESQETIVRLLDVKRDTCVTSADCSRDFCSLRSCSVRAYCSWACLKCPAERRDTFSRLFLDSSNVPHRSGRVDTYCSASHDAAMSAITSLIASLCMCCGTVLTAYVVYYVFIRPRFNPITRLPGPPGNRLLELRHMSLVME